MDYLESHNDISSRYEDAQIDHWVRTGHEPKFDKLDCGVCDSLFDLQVDEGLFCAFHPESYYDPESRFCEECELEEISAAELIQPV